MRTLLEFCIKRIFSAKSSTPNLRLHTSRLRLLMITAGVFDSAGLLSIFKYVLVLHDSVQTQTPFCSH